ncbi:transposon Tf2-9 polyprotein [Trichonephila clavipes]|nr:transposon Tf2-9 polyprotein [Trichonephila clavipes]
MSEGSNLASLQVWKKTELHTDACKQGYGVLCYKKQKMESYIPFTTCRKTQNTAEEKMLSKTKTTAEDLGNPIRIISDRGSAFTSKLFNDYRDEENIQHLQIAPGVPRGNGQVERIHQL